MEADILEHILDGTKKPTNLPFSLLKSITEHFSEDRVIGQGGFATVYKGVLPNMTVAVKRIRNDHSIDEKLFYREVDSLLTINHQNVVRFLGFCASTDQTAIKVEGLRQHIYAEIRERLLCFEYMSNGSLQKHIADELRGLEWNTRYQIIKGICEGLHHLHKEKHIYHMDLKPANILLDDHMTPKITDFGLSRLDEKSQTMTKDRYGSLGYCALEYLRSGKMSFKSDMFSLGVIITQLVTGDKGIPDSNKNNVLRRWRHRWKKSGMEAPLIYQQVAKCMEIGLLCQELDPSKRPFVWDVIHDIREMEGVNGETSNAYEYTFGQISPYSEDDMLGVDPLVLHFPFELNKQISCSLQLTNQTDAYIAFSILNTSPLPYCTQPNKGIAPPRSKCSIDITLQAQDRAPRNMRHAEEFIVWSTKVNDGLAADDITTNMFNKESGVVDAVNLDVVFNAEESTKANDGPAAEDITTNISNKETCVVDKMQGVAWPSLYAVRATSPLLAGLLPSPARSTPRRFFKRPFPPPSLSKHIKARLAKRLGGGTPKEGTVPGEGVVGAGASDGLIRDRAEAEMSLDKKVGRGHSADIYFDTVKGDYKGQTIAVKIISKTKVYTRGAMDRSIDISQYAGYDELRHALARMFSVEGQLEELQRIGWKLVYVDHEDDILLLGDDPWDEFINCVKCIKILSPQEVEQLRLGGDLGNQSSPISGLLQLGCPGENFGATHQLRKEVGRGSDIVKKGIISTTKVCKRGAVGRSIVISQYAGYDELKPALARMFSIDGQLEERGKIGYKLLYIDREDNVLLVGNDPWEKFARCVKCIRILSPQEVQQLSLAGDMGTDVLPNQACSSSDGRGDVFESSL